MTKDKPEHKAKDKPEMNATPAPAKKAAGKAATGEVKAKAKKPAKEPAKAAPTASAVPEAATPAPKAEEPKHVAPVAAAPVEIKPRRQVLTASEQRMMENKPAGSPPEPKITPAPASAPAPAAAAAPVAKAAPADKPSESASSVADDAALAAQQLKDKIVVIKPPIIVKDLAAKLGLKPYQIIHHLMEMNIFTSASQALEEEVARKLSTKLGFTFEIEKRE